MSDARKATIDRFTNLFDGGILPKTSVATIIDYYVAQLNNIQYGLKESCNITNNFIQEEIQEIEDNEDEITEEEIRDMIFRRNVEKGRDIYPDY
jgi:hypothetical protein